MRFLRAVILAVGVMGLAGACGGGNKGESTMNTENPCASNPCAENPCGANPCGANPCGANPCAENPCAKNPCGGSW